jgi:ribonuclease G
VVLSEETVAIEVERKLRDLAAEKPKVEAFLIQVNPRVSSVLLSGPGRPPLLEIEEDVHKHFHFEGSEGLPIDHFAVTLEGTRAEVEERALPFREGEEVLVTIEEPHMYNEDDAVAKVDGYVISVARGVKHLGEKRLVRIEGVSRSAASATIVDNGADAAQAEEEKPKQRSRGRRGGRGRRTKAASE